MHVCFILPFQTSVIFIHVCVVDHRLIFYLFDRNIRFPSLYFSVEKLKHYVNESVEVCVRIVREYVQLSKNISNFA